MGAFDALCEYYNRPLFEIAQDLKYGLSNIYILKGEEDIIREEFPDVYSNLLSCSHNRDNRTVMKYAQDLVASWIFEDNIVIDLQKSGLNIKKAGADKHRKILPKCRISSGSDTKVFVNSKELYMEIMCDYKDLWANKNRVDLRDNKYNKLIKEKALFLGFDICNKNYLMIDFSQPVEAEYIPIYYPYGGKPAYSIKFKNIYNLSPVDLNEIVAEIISLANNR